MPFFELVSRTSILLKFLSLVQHMVTYDIFGHTLLFFFTTVIILNFETVTMESNDKNN